MSADFGGFGVVGVGFLGLCGRSCGCVVVGATLVLDRHRGGSITGWFL